MVFALITALFFLSGFAGLAYQVLWMRMLGLFFGSDMYGVSIILSTFMGGLALGSLLGGRLAEQTRRPLLWYGVAEIGIGGFALGFAPLLALFEPLLHTLYPPSPTDGKLWVFQIARVLLASGVLLFPTACMGATLPLIMRHFVRNRRVLGRLAAHFYAVNTLGALAGTLAAGFLLLPYLGTRLSNGCAAALNLAIGGICVSIGLQRKLPDWPLHDAPSDLDPLPGVAPEARRRMAHAAVIAIGVSGFAAFALEVVWTRILLLSFSATVYSFASMLACFLFGIFLGSRGIASSVDWSPNPIRLFAALELGVGVSVGALSLLVYGVPSLFGRLMSGVALLLGEARDHTLVVSTLVASFLLLLVPTTLLGATFSVALRAYTTNVSRVGSRTGNLYAANTIGAILGSLSGGFLMIPALGTVPSLSLVALLFAGVGMLLLREGQLRHSSPFFAGAATAAATTALMSSASLFMPHRVILNFNQRAHVGTKLLYHREGVQNTIDVIRSKSGVNALVIGGNVEADDSELQRRHFVLKGHLPLMFLAEPRTVLVIGLGMGITLRATARHPGLERIDVVEISPEVVEAQAYLSEVNEDVLRNPLVHVRIDDGRLYMKLSRARYDMITADPIHPKVSRVGYLYTREYYESIRDRLNDQGVVCQWLPLYQMAPLRLRAAVKTFIEVFPEATLWYVRNHALLIAWPNPRPIDYRLLERKFDASAVRRDFESVGIRTPEELLAHLIMGPREIRAFVDAAERVPLNTDEFPYLEYFVPGDLFYGTDRNIEEIGAHMADPTLYVENLSAAAARRIRATARARAASLRSGRVW